MKKTLFCLISACLLLAACKPAPETPPADNGGDNPKDPPREFAIGGADEYSLVEISEDGKTITLTTKDGAPKQTEDGKDYKTGYILSGDFKGQIVTTDKTTLNLNGVKLSNKDAPAIYAEKKVEIKTEAETTNTVTTTGDYDGDNKTGAITGEKKVEIGGSGTLVVSGSVNHGIKGNEVEIKGSGTITVSGSSDGSAINCNTFTVGEGKTFTLNLKDSKNGIKADESINIESGTFNLSNISKTGFKTDTKKDDAKKEGYDPEKPIIHKIYISSDAKVEYGDVPKKADSETVDIPEEA